MSLVSQLSSAFSRVAQEVVLRGLPAGGTAGQAPVKQSETDFDVAWQTVGAGSSSQRSVMTLEFANGDGTVVLPDTAVILEVEYVGACRFRLYRTESGRSADAGRKATELYPGGHELVYEYVSLGAETDDGVPLIAHRAEGETQLYYRVDGGPATITLTLKEI